MSESSNQQDIPESNESDIVPPLEEEWPIAVDVLLILPDGQEVLLPSVQAQENLQSIRQALFDFQETAFLTNFRFQFRYTTNFGGVKDLDTINSAEYSNEYQEINAFIKKDTKSCAFEILPDLYDLKSARVHVKRLYEALHRQHFHSVNAKVPDLENGEIEAKQSEATLRDGKAIENLLPTIDSIILEPVQLSKYLNYTLNPEAHDIADKAMQGLQPLNSVIKGVFASGWNPPPPLRKLQGDLMYLEVNFANEGAIYITATPKGFYVNKSNRTFFDPSPAQNPHFSHTLFHTILSVSAPTRTAWSTLCTASKAYSETIFPGPLDNLIRTLSGFKSENITQLPSSTWAIPQSSDSSAQYYSSKQSYDHFRAQEFGADLCGMEELSAPRDWNEEIQSIRSLTAEDLDSRMLKARLEHRVITEFTEACKKVVVSITEGLITPLTLGQPDQPDVFVYNGIFVSTAEETKDTFGICVGEEASRKALARDLLNQKLIRSLNIPGLGSVLSCCIDYKGTRYIAQSIIPGIIGQSDSGATLTYGIMEKNKAITAKTSSFKMMDELRKQLALALRNVPAYPFGEEQSVEVKDTVDKPTESLSKLLRNPEATSLPIKIDDSEGVPIDPVTKSIQHTGPIEGKIIRGTDGKTYLLELMRITPKDANYLPLPQGTGLFSDDLLSKVDKELSSTYVLRQELVSIYLHRAVSAAKQSVIQEIAEKRRANEELKAVAEGEAGDKTTEQSESKDEDAHSLSAEEEKSIADEYSERLGAITTESLGIEINPNCFLSFPVDVDEAIVKKDEDTARDIAKLLSDVILPSLVKQVREGDLQPRDSDALVTTLHAMGVNMRYLGKLVEMTHQEEKEDDDFHADGKQRIKSMPRYWLELLLVEMIARGVKHVLNRKLRENAIVRSSPAQTIASLLNHVMSALRNEDDSAATTTAAAAAAKDIAAGSAGSASSAQHEDDKKSKKKKKGKTHSPPSASAAESLSPVDGFPSKSETLAALTDLIQSRFLYDLVLFKAIQSEGTPSYRSRESLSRRVSPILLLRRICQQCGLVVNLRDYDFSSASPFKLEDIVAINPKATGCEPEEYLPEVKDYLATSNLMLQQGNAVVAFDLAQQAMNLITQITGPGHAHAYRAAEQMTNVILSTADPKTGLNMTSRSLSLAVQTFGLDSQEAIAHHLHFSMLNMDLDNIQAAFNYLLSARYLTRLTGGEHHPELMAIFIRLGVLYEKAGSIDSALKCMLMANQYCSNDMFKVGSLFLQIAALCFRHNALDQAVAYQKRGYKLFKELLPANDDRILDLKKDLEMFIRKESEAAPQMLRMSDLSASVREQLENEIRKAMATDISQDAENDNAEASSKNKKKRNSKKTKAKK